MLVAFLRYLGDTHEGNRSEDLGDPGGLYSRLSNGPEPEFTSHETVCLLNTADQDAHILITVFFSDREPAGPYAITVAARRTKHVRFNDLRDPKKFRLLPILPASSNRTCQSWYSTHASTHAKQKTLYSARSLTGNRPMDGD